MLDAGVLREHQEPERGQSSAGRGDSAHGRTG
jgi:hypothetical protein